MTISKIIQTYKVKLIPGDTLESGGNLVWYHTKSILLKTKDRWEIWVYFLETVNKGDALPDSVVRPEKKEIYAFRRAEDFIPTLDVLRNEKPVFWVAFSADLLHAGAIQTRDEEVGEEEFDPETGSPRLPRFPIIR